MDFDLPIAVQADFRVLYEDEGVLVVDKSAPLLTHPTGPKNEPTLWHGIRELLAYELATGGQVSLINRLDRETSGITLVAKTAEAARELGKAMQNRLLHKEYWAIVQGAPLWETACCAEPILRMEAVAPTRVHVRQCCHAAGKACHTDFRVEQRLPGCALLRCIPHTGRMHQIRVHLEYLGFPLVGDKIYGGDEGCYLAFMEQGWTPQLERCLLLPRHALHACSLRFPWHGKEVQVESPLPPDMALLLASSSAPTGK
ncbi:MAG: RluA family pseudouridine synthase [Akkermansia sp.]|nr:RluA family pseudouridine synthase [Akkermansia sp.]